MIDWSSFWINIYAGSIYFLLGIIVSIWLIPRFTIRLLKRKNIIHFRTKITFVISELCDFLNHMPKEIKVNEDSTKFLVKNKTYSDIFDFVAILKPNVLKPGAQKQLMVNILTCVTKYTGEDRYNFVYGEVERLKPLQYSLENILTAHSLNIDDKTISTISTLCIEIRLIVNDFRFNATIEELTGAKEGISGANRLEKIYEIIIQLLRLLEKENGIKRE